MVLWTAEECDRLDSKRVSVRCDTINEYIIFCGTDRGQGDGERLVGLSELLQLVRWAHDKNNYIITSIDKNVSTTTNAVGYVMAARK